MDETFTSLTSGGADSSPQSPTAADQSGDDLRGGDLDFFGDVPLWTPEVDRMCQKVANWIRCDLSGGIVHGMQHIGKTWAGAYIEATVPTILGRNLVVVRWLTEQNLKKTQEGCLQTWLRQSGCRDYNQSKRDQLQSGLCDFLNDMAAARGASRILIILDDAHWLNLSFYQLLMTLYNDLMRLKRRTFVLQIGQPELRQMKATFLGQDALQLVNRFFAVHYEYRGLGVDDLKDFFDQMEASRNGGFSAHYLRHLAARGFALADLAKPLEEALQLIAAAQNIKGELRMPMGRLRSTVCSILYRLLADTTIVQVTPQMAFAALSDCEVPDILRHYVSAA